MKFWQRLSGGFLNLLDTENVKLYVWPYYLALWSFGVTALLAEVPLTLIMPVMGNAFYLVWVIVMVSGTTQVMTGLVISRKDIGLWLQLGGNVSCALVLAAYEVAAWATWGFAAFTFYVVGPYVLGCIFLALTVIRKIYLVEQVKGEIDEGII